MKKGLTEIVVILDRSGSMVGVVDEVRTAFNAFVEEQKKLPGEANLSLVLFDDQYQPTYRSKPIDEAPPLGEEYFARGWTALLDAVGRTISDVGAELDSRPESEKPERVLVVIHTDGQENKSREYAPHMVKKMIEHQRDKYNWEFLFMGADQDAWTVGAGIGIAAVNTMAYDNLTQNSMAFAALGRTMATYRSTGDATFQDQDLRTKTPDPKQKKTKP